LATITRSNKVRVALDPGGSREAPPIACKDHFRVQPTVPPALSGFASATVEMAVSRALVGLSEHFSPAI
jgi:hypothetical protein